MAIEFTHRGKRWRADTVEEAVKLRTMLEEIDKHEEIDPDQLDWETKRESVWTPDVFWTFVNAIKPQQAKAVAVLLRYPTIKSTELAKHLGIEELSLAGVFSGLSKQMKALDLHPMQLYQTHLTWNGGERLRFLQIDHGFRLAAAEADWPNRKERHASATNRKRK